MKDSLPGRTSRLPPSLKKDAEKRRKRKKEPEEKAPRAPLPSIADFCTQACKCAITRTCAHS